MRKPLRNLFVILAAKALFISAAFFPRLAAGEEASAAQTVSHSGFCNAVLTEDFSSAIEISSRSDVNLAAPCKTGGYEYSAESMLEKILTFLSQRGERDSKNEAIARLVRLYIEALGGLTSVHEDGLPLFWSLREHFFPHPNVGRVLLGANFDPNSQVGPVPFGVDAFRMTTDPGRDPAGQTLLMDLCGDNTFKRLSLRWLDEDWKTSFRSLLKDVLSKSNLSLKDGLGRTALHHCVLHGNHELARVLLAKGADPSEKDFANLTPADYASARGESFAELSKSEAQEAGLTESISSSSPSLESSASSSSSSSLAVSSSQSSQVPSSQLPASQSPASQLPTPAFSAGGPTTGATKAREAIERGDFSQARALLGAAVAQDDPAAMYELGRLFARGEGGPQDFQKARSLWEHGAEKSEPRCLIGLSKLYFYGDGVEKSKSVAKMYAEKARALGAQVSEELLK